MSKIANAFANFVAPIAFQSATPGTVWSRIWVCRTKGNATGFKVVLAGWKNNQEAISAPYTVTATMTVGVTTYTLRRNGNANITVNPGETVNLDVVNATRIFGQTATVAITHISGDVPIVNIGSDQWNGNGGQYLTPLAILATVADDEESGVFVGDSINYGTGRTDNPEKGGMMSTAYRDNYPFTIIGFPGGLVLELVQAGANAPIYNFLQAANPSCIYCEAKVNDLGAGADGRKWYQIVSDINTVHQRMRNVLPDTFIVETTCTPNENFNVINQRASLNDAVRKVPDGANGFVDVCCIYERSRNDSVWANGDYYTGNDRTHPNDLGYDAIKPVFKPMEQLRPFPSLKGVNSAFASSCTLEAKKANGSPVWSNAAEIVAVRRVWDNRPLDFEEVEQAAGFGGTVTLSRAANLPPVFVVVDLDATGANGLPEFRRYQGILMGADACPNLYSFSVADTRGSGEYVGGTMPIVEGGGGADAPIISPVCYGFYLINVQGAGVVTINADPGNWYGLADADRYFTITVPAPDVVAIRQEVDDNSVKLGAVTLFTEDYSSVLDVISVQTTSIQAKTDGLPTDPADQSVLVGLINALPTVEQIADAVEVGASEDIAEAVLSASVDGEVSFADAMKILVALTTGAATRSLVNGTLTYTFKDSEGTPFLNLSYPTPAQRESELL